MSEWKEYKLGDVLDVKHGFAFSGQSITDEPCENVLVTPGNFHIGGGFKSSKFKYFNGKFPKEYILNGGDIVVTMTDLSQETDTLGYAAKIPMQAGVKYLHNQRIGLLEFTSEELSKDFVYWLMRTKDYQAFIVGSASGTSIMHTAPKRIKEYSFFAPSKNEQTAIASILNSLDDKIDLLHRQNKMLEAMAGALFREWFVENANEDWEKKTLYDTIELVGGGTPKTEIQEYWDGAIKWLSGKDITASHKNFARSSEKTITTAGLKNSSAKLLPQFATVISARGTVGKYCMLSVPMAFSQTNYGILPKYPDCYFFTYLLMAYSVSELQSAAYGSVFDTITTDTFKQHQISLPESETIFAFEKIVANYFEKMLANTRQILTLAHLRDALLPKLMSGDVRIKIA